MGKGIGKGLVETASHAIVDATILAVLREANSKAKQIRALALFGKEAELTHDKWDLPLVQTLKESAILYQTAKDTGDLALAAQILKGMMGTLSSWEGVLNQHLGAALRVSLEKARIESKTRKNGAISEADLLDMVAERASPAEPQPAREEASHALKTYVEDDGEA